MRKREIGGKDARVLRLVFFQNVRLHGAAHRAQGVGLDAQCFFSAWLAFLFRTELIHLLIDGGV